MNILQVIPYFIPAWGFGGPLRVAWHFSTNLIKRGHTVTVLTTDAMDTGERIASSGETIDGIRVVRFRNKGYGITRKFKMFYTPGMAAWLDTEIHRYDVVHLHEYRSFQNIFVRKYAGKYNVPYLVQAHGALQAFDSRRFLKKTFDTLWGNNILSDAKRCLALSVTESQHYRSMGVPEDKIRILPTGIDVAGYDTLPEKGQFKSKYGIGNDRKIVLYLGRLHQSKGIDLLVIAFAGVSETIDTASLVIVGPDEGVRFKLESLVDKLGIADKVLFTGPVYGDERLTAYIDADVFVTPVFSGFPMTFLESAACGTPVITTVNGDDLGWINDEAGYVTECDPDSLKDAIIRILSDDSLAHELGSNAQRIVGEKFGWEKLTEDLEGIYRESVSSG